MKAQAKKKLHVYVLQFNRNYNRWFLTSLSGALVDVEWNGAKKHQAIRNAATLLKEWLVDFGQHSELRIRNLDGTFAPARTYGRDPKKSKG